MSMNAGRLIWSKPRSSDSWHVSSLADERTMYVCSRGDHDGWLAKVVRRLDDQTNAPPGHVLVETVDLGWGIYLFTAKRFCDQHHHKAILASDDESLKGYVQRWPL